MVEPPRGVSIEIVEDNARHQKQARKLRPVAEQEKGAVIEGQSEASDEIGDEAHDFREGFGEESRHALNIDYKLQEILPVLKRQNWGKLF